MAVIQDHVDVQAILQTAVAPRAGFGLQLFLVDTKAVPIDQIFRLTTKQSYADDYVNYSEVFNYCQTFFAQKRVADELMIGRFIDEDTAVKYVMPNYNTDYTDWELIADGAFKVTSSAPASTVVSGIDFSGITSKDQILTKLNAALAALVAPAVTGLDSAVFEYDALDRLVLSMDGAFGAGEPTVVIEAPGVGTDLSGATYMNVGIDDVSVEGYDAESPVDALIRISQVNDTYYNVHERGCNGAQQLLLAQYIETQEKLLDLFVTNADAKDPTKTTDIGYLTKALSLKRTLCIYTEKTTEYPDGAVSGCVLPASEGTVSFAYEVLSQVTDSGLTKPLTVTERSALSDKNYCWIETIGSNTYLYDGITSGGEEKRIMLGRDWFVARIREAIFADMLNSDFHAFDLPTFTKIEGFIRDIGDQAVARGILVDGETDPDRAFTVTMPDPADFDAAERATHEFDREDIFIGYLNSVINDYQIVGTWSI